MRVAVWLSLVGYFAALALRIGAPLRANASLTNAAAANQQPRAWNWARRAWLFGWVLCVTHVAMAIFWQHHGSQVETARFIAVRTGDFTEQIGMPRWEWTGGLYLNYLFLLVWLADLVVWYARGHVRYAQLPLAYHALVQGYLGFMAFQASVVFALGPVRYFALAAYVGLAVLAWRSWSVTRADRQQQDAAT